MQTITATARHTYEAARDAYIAALDTRQPLPVIEAAAQRHQIATAAYLLLEE